MNQADIVDAYRNALRRPCAHMDEAIHCECSAVILTEGFGIMAALSYQSAARAVNRIRRRTAGARDRAKAAGRVTVAHCRQSDVETCQEIARLLNKAARAARVTR